MKHNTRYELLDFARGISAIAVCAGHLRAAVMINYAQAQQLTVIDKLFYFLTGLGHQAIIVFFVLSGFFVGGSVMKSREIFSFLHYSVARLARLWTVLLPTLLITFAIDFIIETNAPNILQGQNYNQWNSGPSPGSYSNSIATFIGNIFFLQTITVPVFGTNSPLWSLANEFWYYAIFPLLTKAIGISGDKNKKLERTACGVLALGILYFIPKEIAIYFGIWLMGVLSYLLHSNIRHSNFWFYSTGIAFLLSLVYSKIPAWESYIAINSDFLIGIFFSLFCVFLVNRPRKINIDMHKIFMKISLITSEVSYSLYLSHFSFVVFIAALVFSKHQAMPSLSGYIQYFASLSFLFIVASVFWYLFERQTYRVRAFVLALLNIPSK